jgi:sugar (pentulose or hexulose) kinase
MEPLPVIAVFDVGKTNKKLFLFDEQYQIVMERSARFTETEDEDGDPCENLESLRLSVFDSLREVFARKEFAVRAVNFATYGASLVCIDEGGRPLTPLYNYLKPYPERLKRLFYDTYGGETDFSRTTASPVLGSLNAGMQLYRLKYEKPEVLDRTKYVLHLPQYMSFLISGKACSDITSIGCHTNLWDFGKGAYHHWVEQEGLLGKLAPLAPSDSVFPSIFPGNDYQVGIGLHDSSAALIPYLLSFHEPFVLISTGTWSISLNPFNRNPLTADELEKDCLSYLSFEGRPIKASRLFAGYEHDEQVRRIAEHFAQSPGKYKAVPFEQQVIDRLQKGGRFSSRNLSHFTSDTEAYHQLILDMVVEQHASTQLVLGGTPVKRIFVDGGFSKNPIFMHLMAAFFPDVEVFAASMAQATAIGTALAIHSSWNSKPLPGDIIALKYYSTV